MKFYAATIRGVNKTSSEDRILLDDMVLKETVRVYETEQPQIFGICDGVGGISGGALASDFLCQNAKKYLLEDPETGAKRLASALLEYAQGFVQERRMASTMTMVLPSKNIIVHVGNTRVYRMIRGYLRQITTEHTTRQMLIQQNRFEAAAAVSPTQLSGCMGGGSMRFSAQTECIPMPTGNLVITSDGIHDTLSQEVLEELLLTEGDMLENIQNIVKMAVEKGSVDDKSILVVQR